MFLISLHLGIHTANSHSVSGSFLQLQYVPSLLLMYYIKQCLMLTFRNLWLPGFFLKGKNKTHIALTPNNQQTKSTNQQQQTSTNQKLPQVYF